MSASAPLLDEGLLAPGTQVGEYEIERLLGVGGMGEVYGARQPVIGKQVAIKVMSRDCSANPTNVERFVQEAKAVNAIAHANIVDIFSFGRTSDDRCYFVMEWLPGQSLRHRIDAQRLSPDAVCDVLDAVLQALEAAHEHAIVHRDLKPDNIFCVSGRREGVKLLDFGVAKLSGESFASKRASKTQTGTVIGTPSYMAPEQAAGARIEAPADIYSLGVVAFELATGRLPFDAESMVQIMAMHVCEPPPRPRSIAPMTREMEQLILDMLEKQPADRPTAAQVRARLVHVRAAIAAGIVDGDEVATIDGLSPVSPSVTPLPEAPRPRARRFAVGAIAVAMLAVVAVVAIAATRGGGGGSGGSGGGGGGESTPVPASEPVRAAVSAPVLATTPVPAPEPVRAAVSAPVLATTPDATVPTAIVPLATVPVSDVKVRVRPHPPARVGSAAPPPPPVPRKRDVDAVRDPFTEVP